MKTETLFPSRLERYRSADATGAAPSGESGVAGWLQTRRRAARGMTLTELLVVIIIMVVLLGASLPVMRTAMKGRALREASRQLNTYVQLAKSRAAETGRPVGLWLETEDLQYEEKDAFGPPPPAIRPAMPFARQLFLAETPPPYSGDFSGAVIQVSSTEVPRLATETLPVGAVLHAATVTAARWAENANFFNLVSKGAHIKFNFRGPSYEVFRVPDPRPIAGPAVICFLRLTGQPAPPNGEVQYQVFRTPLKSSSVSLELTGGAVIDMTNSGSGLSNAQFAVATTPAVIMFEPNGAVSSVMFNGSSLVPTSTLHLMIGGLAQMMEPGVYSSAVDPHNRNPQDTENLWVSIGHQTGSVVTADNAWEDRGDFAASLSAAREFAQQAQAKGGR